MTRFSGLYKEFLIPSLLLSALIIGAGMFALPYLFEAAGFIAGTFYLAALSVIVSIIHLMYADIVSNTEGLHRFVGYARIYLGGLAFLVSFVTTAIGNIITLLIYIILSVSFINILLPQLHDLVGLIIFWLIATASVMAGIKRMAGIEFWSTILTIIIVLFIFFSGISGLDFESRPLLNLDKWYLPYGAVLFALGGRAAISSIKTYLQSNNLSDRYFRRSVVFGTFVPAILYLLFIIGIWGLSPGQVSEDAISGFVSISPFIAYSIAALGLFELWTSYIFLGIEAKEILSYDINVSKKISSGFVMFLPIFLYIVGLNNFISIVGIAGGVFLAIESVFVILMWRKLKVRSSLVSKLCMILVALFILGGLQELIL